MDLRFVLVLVWATYAEAANQQCGRCTDPVPTVDNGVFVPLHGHRLAELQCDPGYAPAVKFITCVSEQWELGNGMCIGQGGTDFVTVFPQTVDQDVAEEKRSILVTAGDTPTQVTIDVDGDITALNLMQFEEQEFDIDLTQTSSDTITQDVLHITSDFPITVHTLVSTVGDTKFSVGSFIILPVASLSMEYKLMTTADRPQFNIIAVQNDTDVTIQLSSTSTITRTLQQYEVYTRSFSGTDRTGNDISATNPVAVLGGGSFSRVPDSGSGIRDLNVVQLIGVEYWKNLCVMGPYKPREGFQFKVVASLDSTQVDLTVNGVTDTISLNEGELYTQVVYPNLTDQNVVVQSDKPTLVGHFSLNNNVGDENNNADSSMLLCVPPADFLPLYRFFVPVVNSTVRIVIKSANVDKLRLDGAALTPFDQINGVMVPGGESYDIVYITVTTGNYYELKTTNGESFGADLYGVIPDVPTKYAHTLGRNV